MKYNKGFAPLIILAIVAGALIIGGGVYYLGKSSEFENKKIIKDPNVIVGGSLPSKPSIYVYKTKKDDSNLVPVMLFSSNGKSDTMYTPEKSYIPTPLHKEYYTSHDMDENSVFLNLTIDEYNKMQRPFSSSQLIKLKNLITDMNPFLEFYDCTYEKNQDPISTINSYIDNNQISTHCVSRLTHDINDVSISDIKISQYSK